LPLLRDGRQGTVHSLRAADAVGSSLVIAEGLKYLVKEQRPNHADHQSFPSGHAVAAFAAATAEAQYHPREAVYWYLGAAAIGQSRVRLKDHYERDVISGALLGYGMTRLELCSPHGLILAPFIDPAQRAAGLTLTTPMK
jgi:membrane-associated phospholipid phosphatase